MPSAKRVILKVSIILYLIYGRAFIKRKHKLYYMTYNIVFWINIQEKHHKNITTHTYSKKYYTSEIVLWFLSEHFPQARKIKYKILDTSRMTF